MTTMPMTSVLCCFGVNANANRKLTSLKFQSPIWGDPFDFRSLWPNSPTTDQALIGFNLLPTPSDRIPGTPELGCDVARRFRHSTPGRRTASAPAAEHCSWLAAPFG